jgi:L-fuculose-phosphate aldolase
VRVTEYAPPGTEELADKAVEALEERSAALISNHGLVTLGKDLETAMDIAVLVERAAQICIFTRLLGLQRALPPEVLAMEEALFKMRLSAEGSL